MDEEDVAWLKLMNEKRKSKFFSLVGGEKHKENVRKQNERKEKLYMYGILLLGLSGMTGMFVAPVHCWNLASCINSIVLTVQLAILCLFGFPILSSQVT